MCVVAKVARHCGSCETGTQTHSASIALWLLRRVVAFLAETGNVCKLAAFSVAEVVIAACIIHVSNINHVCCGIRGKVVRCFIAGVQNVTVQCVSRDV